VAFERIMSRKHQFRPVCADIIHFRKSREECENSIIIIARKYLRAFGRPSHQANAWFYHNDVSFVLLQNFPFDYTNRNERIDLNRDFNYEKPEGQFDKDEWNQQRSDIQKEWASFWAVRRSQHGCSDTFIAVELSVPTRTATDSLY
jgi:hypothetical protein